MNKTGLGVLCSLTFVVGMGAGVFIGLVVRLHEEVRVRANESSHSYESCDQCRSDLEEAVKYNLQVISRSPDSSCEEELRDTISFNNQLKADMWFLNLCLKMSEKDKLDYIFEILEICEEFNSSGKSLIKNKYLVRSQNE